MRRFSRRKSSSKMNETVCSSNGCVGGRNGDEVWPLGAKAVGGAVDTADNYCVSDLQTQPSSYLSHSSDGQNKTRRTRPMSVLHVIRDKLRPSKSRSLQFAECAPPTVQCDTETARSCCDLTNHVCETEYDTVKECCNPTNYTCQCNCDNTGTALPAAEKAVTSDTTENCRTGEVLSTNAASCTNQLIISNSISSSTPKSDSVTDLRCSAVKSHTVHGGLVLSQLSNIVPVEAYLKSDPIAVEGTSRLPLSPVSNSDSGLDTPDERQPARWTLANELLRLSRYGWYWGPVTREEAEEKLSGQPEGAFLVRDSTDDRYLFSLSFRSSGRTLHTRVEYCNGEFSFYAQPQSDSYRSMAELIEQCVAESQSGIFCYSRGTSGISSQSYPVKLTRPVSRFAQVRTLQYLCRFVIRQHTRVDHIQNLPLPVSVKGWLKENQY